MSEHSMSHTNWRRLIVVGVSLISLAVAYPAIAADGENLTLADAQEIALRNHPLLHAAQFDIEAAEQAVRIARAPLYPQVSASAVQAFAQNGARIASIGGLTDPTVIDRGSAGIEVSQLITDFGRTQSEEAASQSEAEAAISQSNLTRADVILKVAQAYYQALDANGLTEVATDTLRQRQVLLNQVSALARAKLKSSLDVSIAAGDLDEAKQFLIDAQAQRESALASLSEALGYADYHVFSLVTPPSIPGVSGTLASYIDSALQTNPQLQALAAKQRAAQENAETARKAFYPRIEALGYTGGTPEVGGGQKIDSTYAIGGIALTVPLFTGGALSAEAHQAEAQASALSYQLEDERNQLLRDVHDAFDDVRASYDNIAVTQSILGNAEQALRLTQARYQIGASSIVDLSEAQLRRTRAAISNTDATYQYLLKRAALDFLIGASNPP